MQLKGIIYINIINHNFELMNEKWDKEIGKLQRIYHRYVLSYFLKNVFYTMLVAIKKVS